MTEEWRPVVEGEFEVSNLGRVRSLDRVIKRGDNRMTLKGRIRKLSRNRHGYMVVKFYDRGPVLYVHHLVLTAFDGPRPAGMTHIRHLNGNPADNRLTNLAYGTPSENGRDMVAHGRSRNQYTKAMNE